MRAGQKQNFVLVTHALARHKLTLMRDKTLKLERFRRLMHEIGLIMCAEATRDLDLQPWPVETPFGMAEGETLRQSKLVVVPILRAGLVMADAFSQLLPMARTGHIGLFRENSENAPTNYLTSIPSAPVTDFFIVDPLIATSKTIQKAVQILLDLGIVPGRIRVVSLIVAREGLESFYSHPSRVGIRLFALEVDPDLNAHGYIIPGLGDAGDRLFGTEKV